ncbi:MAG: hypothetical protein RR949_05145, partial [Oscillospiraceae bacterium]
VAGYAELTIKDGIVTKADPIVATAAAHNFYVSATAGVFKAAAGTIGLGGVADATAAAYYSYNADTKVFFIKNGVITEGAISDVATDANDTVVATVVKGDATGDNLAKTTTLTALYVTIVGDDGGVIGDADPGAPHVTGVELKKILDGTLSIRVTGTATPAAPAPTLKGTVIVEKYSEYTGKWINVTGDIAVEILNEGTHADVVALSAGAFATGEIYRATVTINGIVKTSSNYSIPTTGAAFT